MNKCPDCNDYGELPNGSVCPCEKPAPVAPVAAEVPPVTEVEPAEEPEMWDDLPAVAAESPAAPVASGPVREALPDPWEEYGQICVPLEEAPCPVRLPDGTRTGRRLHLSASRISLYHEFIAWDGEGADDCPASLSDSIILLFLAAHHPETWTAETELGPPLRRSWDRFRACVDAWADVTFGTAANDRAEILATARRLWQHHCAARVVPQKKTARRTTRNASPSGPPPQRSSSGCFPVVIWRAVRRFWTGGR